MKFQENFLIELFAWCFRKRDILDICIKNLQYQYIHQEQYKHIWKGIKSHYETTNKIPTIGIIAQAYTDKREVIECLNKIKQVQLGEIEDILTQFEQFIKDCYFQEQYDKITDTYNQKDKVGAYSLIKEAGEFLFNFSVKKDTVFYDRVFGRYDERMRERAINPSQELYKNKCPFFIDEIDEILRGGCNKGDTWLALAQSGVGKSKLLKWVGVNNARIGNRVLHIQAEGSKKECMDLYDATWSGQRLYEIEEGFCSRDEKLVNKLKKVVRDITNNNGEIYVYASEQFDTLSMRDIRNIIIDVEKLYGKLDLVLIDYLDEVDSGDGKKYSVSEERQKRNATAKKMKNIAVEFDVCVGTATQASKVNIEQLNNPQFIMTRNDISEGKGLLQSFSYFFTMNQTKDEYDNSIIRLFFDKIRKYKGQKLITIAQAYDYEKFYDRKRTLELFNLTESSKK